MMFRMILDYDFNDGKDEWGFRDVPLDNLSGNSVNAGDEVILTDGDGLSVRGKVRSVVAIVEDIGPIETNGDVLS